MSEVKVRIVGDNSSLTGALNASDNSIMGWAGKIGGVFKGLLAFAGGAALGGLFKKSVTEAIEAERGIEALRVTVDNAGASFTAWSPKIEGVIDRLQRTTRFTDDELRGALSRMIVITGDVEGSLRNLSLTTDVAADKNRGLEDASKIVGLAMQGNGKALRQYGIDLKETANPVEDLRDKVIGLAAAQVKGGGVLDQVKKQLGEVLEAIGGVIIGTEGLESSGNKLADALANLAAWIEKNEDDLRGFGAGIGDVVGGIMTVLQGAGDGLRFLGSLWFTVLSAMGSVAADFVQAIGAVFKLIGVDAVATHGAKLRAIAESHLREAKALGDRATGQTQQHAKNSVLAWEEAQTTILTNEEFYGNRRTSALSKGAADRLKIAQKEFEEHQKLGEKAADGMARTARAHMQRVHQYFTVGTKEAAEAAEQLRLALTGALGDEMRAVLLRSGDAIERILFTLKHRLPVADYERLKALADEFRVALRETLPPADALAASVAALQEDLKVNLGTVDDTKRKFQENVDKVRELASGFLAAAQAAGLVKGEAVEILNASIQIATSLPKALGGDASSIVNVLGQLTNMIAGLGNSELHRRIREVTTHNTRAIEKLTASVGDLALNLPGNKFQGVHEALFAARQAAGPGLLKGTEAEGNRARETLLKELAKRGITRGEAEEVLKTLGVEGVFDKKTVVGLFAIREALEGMSEAEIGKFGDDFSEQLQALQDAFDIFKIEDADDKLAQLAGLLKKQSPAFAQALEGVDLATKEGREKLQENLRALFQKMLGPGLSPKELGDLTGNQVREMIKMLSALLGDSDGLRKFVGPLLGTGEGPPTGGALDNFLPRLDEALSRIPVGSTTNIAGGVNIYVTTKDALTADEVVETIAERVNEIFGRKADAVIAAQGSGTVTV